MYHDSELVMLVRCGSHQITTHLSQGAMLKSFYWPDPFYTASDKALCIKQSGYVRLQEWQKTVDEIHDETDSSTESWSSITRTSTQFKISFDNAGVDVGIIVLKFKEMVEYAIWFLSLSTTDYQAVWWHLFNCPCSGEWRNHFHESTSDAHIVDHCFCKGITTLSISALCEDSVWLPIVRL